MYIATMLNQNNLFQHFGGWVSKPRNNEGNELQVFLFRATQCVISLLRLEYLKGICISQYQKQEQNLNIKTEKIVFWSPTFVEFLNEFSPFLSSLRIMQNLIIPIIGKSYGLKNSLPSSMNDAMKKIYTYGFDKFICDTLTEYWDSNGKDIRDYRDIDQHYHVLIKHSFMQIKPNENLLVLLPDNPKEKNIRFDLKRNALPYFVDSFNNFHTTIEKIAFYMGFSSNPISQTVLLEQIGELTEGVKQTLALMIEDTIKCSGFEFGQTEDRRIYAQPLI